MKNYFFSACLPVKHSLLFFLASLFFFFSFGQANKGILKGKIFDGTTNNTLTGVIVINSNSGATIAASIATGGYSVKLNSGTYSISYSMPGFQNKIISGIKIENGHVTYLNIILSPLSSGTKLVCKDSLKAGDTLWRNSYFRESSAPRYNTARLYNYNGGDIVTSGSINAGNFRNGLAVVKRLSGVVVQDDPVTAPGIHAFIITGLGERYNQLLYNGAVAVFFDPLSRSYPLELLPAEAIEEASVFRTANSALPANFAGGTVSVTTKDYTDKNFFYIRVGAGFGEHTTSQNFYGDKRGAFEFMGLPGSQRGLPKVFPTTKSQFPLSAKNIQEQVYLSQQLKNNLAPVNFGNGRPDEKIMIGFGKNYKLKKSGAIISLTGFINQSREMQINESTVQAAPNTAENPYPFNAPTKPLVAAQSKDRNYTYSSQITGVLNASIVYRKNKISFRNFTGSQFINTYTNRTNVYKPDEDTLAHTGIGYAVNQRYFINSQLAGMHILGENNNLKLDWQAAYTYFNLQNPDEKNILLRQDPGGKELYEIATSINPASITNSSRSWRNTRDNNFSASVNLSFPFNMFHQPQVLAGGINIQQNYRVFNSDLLFTQGEGFVRADKLLAPERYYPGGLSINSYYINFRDPFNRSPARVQPEHRANYNASANLGASYLRLDARLTSQLMLYAGARAETNSQLAANVFYQYIDGFKNPQPIAIDENTRITSFNFLPSASLVYLPLSQFKIVGSYFKTLNRPQLQELTRYAFYDARSFMVKTGNPLLASSVIDNYNASLTFLPDAFSEISAGAFYKKIDQPVEYIVSAYNNGNMLLTPHNTPPAEVKGIEASFRLKLNFINKPWLSGISIFANGNITSAVVKTGPLRSTEIPMVNEHNLSGSPGHTINAGFIMEYPRFPQITVLYNRTGDYLTALGSGTIYTLANGKSIQAVPDYRIAAREQLDIQIAQKLFNSRIQLVAGVNNLTANSYTAYQDLDGNKKFDAALVLKNFGNTGGYFESGTDNTLLSMKQQRTYYFTLSYLFY